MFRQCSKRIRFITVFEPRDLQLKASKTSGGSDKASYINLEHLRLYAVDTAQVANWHSPMLPVAGRSRQPKLCGLIARMLYQAVSARAALLPNEYVADRYHRKAQ